MNRNNCCIKSCKNTAKNSVYKFYKFPRAIQKIDQRTKWIDAVRKVNSDASDWFPTASDKICSGHFINDIKSNDPLSPNYAPKIFSNVPLSKVASYSAALKRHDRFIKRKISKQQKQTLSKQVDVPHTKQCLITDESQNENNLIENHCEDIEIDVRSNECFDKGYQVEIFLKNSNAENTFICNRYIYLSAAGTPCSDAETQTEIMQCSKNSIVQNRKLKDQSCGTPNKSFEDKSIETDSEISQLNKTMFDGIKSVKDNQQLLDLAGVTFNNFSFLLKRINDCDSEKFKLSLENRLFIFLIKMKTGLTFSALSVLFSMHRSTISRIFFSVLDHLVEATSNLIYWPSKDVVRDTMPACFCPLYSNTRVIIDCTEFRIEAPANVDDRVFSFSQYKKEYTAKVFIGSTPGGFISFKSRVAGGRKSDSQITVESNLIDLLETGDTVLADKGFPQIKQVIDKTGKNVMLVMPPFLEKKKEVTEEETKETYNIASVRIHIERIMQRLRIYQILNKIPHNLMNSLDDIIHVACVLVNLQSPIIKKRTIQDESKENVKLKN